MSKFEAEVALNLILTDQFPGVAQDALEAGFDGPHVLRMAILEPVAGWEVDQALPPMLEELGCKRLPAREAALRLAQLRAQRIANTGEDPLASLPYFEQLASKADFAEELFELAYVDDLDFLSSDEERQTRVREALEELLDPELRAKRRSERQAAWEREQARIKSEWPYLLNSPTGRTLLTKRYQEKISDIKPILWIQFVGWILIGWAFGSWRAVVVGFVLTILVMLGLTACGVYMQMRRERRHTLLVRGVSEDQI